MSEGSLWNEAAAIAFIIGSTLLVGGVYGGLSWLYRLHPNLAVGIGGFLFLLLAVGAYLLALGDGGSTR